MEFSWDTRLHRQAAAGIEIPYFARNMAKNSDFHFIIS